MRQALLIFDQRLTDRIHAWPARYKPCMQILSALGSPFVCVSICLVVAAWLYATSRGTSIAFMAAIGAMGLAGTLKLIIRRARPVTPYSKKMRFQTYSFPSGHTFGGTVVYGLSGWVVYPIVPMPVGLLALATVAALAFGIGLSRVYLGAHFVLDVIAGWLSGLVALAVIVLLCKPAL